MLTEFPGRPEKEIILEIMMIHLLFKRKNRVVVVFAHFANDVFQ